MSEYSPAWSLEDLVSRSGVPARTIRYYIAEGLLPGPGARGKSAAYGEDHLLRLLMVRRLVDQRIPLAEIRTMLSPLSLDEVRALLAEEEQRSQMLQQAARSPSPRAYIASLLEQAQSQTSKRVTTSPAGGYGKLSSPPPAKSTIVSHQPSADMNWRRIELAPGLEVHVRSDYLHANPDIVQRIVDQARSEIQRDH